MQFSNCTPQHLFPEAQSDRFVILSQTFNTIAMVKFSSAITAEIEMKLQQIHAQFQDPILFSEQAVIALIPILEELKSFILKYEFESKREEIIFFRDIKPRLASKLIYYNEVFSISTSKPVGSKKFLRKFFMAELRKLEKFFEDNNDFYKYYRTKNRCFDKVYFVRGKHKVKLSLDSYYFQADHRFSTSHDYKVAQILANEMLKEFIEREIKAIDHSLPASSTNFTKNLVWTGSKVALTELIYALHTSSVLNNGKDDLKETVKRFESLFNIDLGQYSRVFIEIRNRKSDRAKFLNELKEILLARMDEFDQN